jgi:cation diffusion facilitator CzcD-associated flavoprotein CzcO
LFAKIIKNFYFNSGIFINNLLELVSDMEKKKVVIIGGGITGLTTAYYLQKEIREKALPLEVKLFEAGERA